MGNAPENVAQPPDYLSYLLRLWRMQGEAAAWRCSVENPHTGERLGFGGLDELFAFLREQTDTPAEGACHHPEEVEDD
jgi:hypothetical protein